MIDEEDGNGRERSTKFKVRRCWTNRTSGAFPPLKGIMPIVGKRLRFLLDAGLMYNLNLVLCTLSCLLLIFGLLSDSHLKKCDIYKVSVLHLVAQGMDEIMESVLPICKFFRFKFVHHLHTFAKRPQIIFHSIHYLLAVTFRGLCTCLLWPQYCTKERNDLKKLIETDQQFLECSVTYLHWRL